MADFRDGNISDRYLSKYRKVYVVSYNDGKLCSESFPIIYMNKKYTYYHQHGAEDISRSMNCYTYIGNTDEFKSKIINQLVDMKFVFSKMFCLEDPRKSLNELNKNIKKYKSDYIIKNLKNKIDSKTHQRDRLDAEIDELTKKLNEVQDV